MLKMQPQNIRRRAVRGFTLVEILIVVVILGILAMIVVPHFVNAQQPAREGTLRENLRSMRTQIELFAAQHEELPPGYPNGDRNAAPTEATLIAHFTTYTSVDCQTSATYSAATPIRPQLLAIPANPFNQLSAVRVLGNGDSFPAADGATYGWFYKPFTREFKANTPGSDETGRPFIDY
jgi:prepilin-type N-terminal cleavage/methylation domain-containing protein